MGPLQIDPGNEFRMVEWSLNGAYEVQMLYSNKASTWDRCAVATPE